MTWFGSAAYIIAAGSIVAATLLLDGWFMHTGQIVRNHRRVPHRKLRAVPRRKPATGLHAPSTVPVAGPQHPTGSAVPSSVEPPAPGSDPSEPGAGHTPLPAAVPLTMPGGGQAPNSVGAHHPDRAPTGPAVEATTAQPPRVASTAPTRSAAA